MYILLYSVLYNVSVVLCAMLHMHNIMGCAMYDVLWCTMVDMMFCAIVSYDEIICCDVQWLIYSG